MLPKGLTELKTACHKLDNQKLSKEAVTAWNDLLHLMPTSSQMVVRKRISRQLMGEQGVENLQEDLMLLEPVVDELLTLVPDRITNGFKKARLVLGKPIMNEYLVDVASHLKTITGVR